MAKVKGKVYQGNTRTVAKLMEEMEMYYNNFHNNKVLLAEEIKKLSDWEKELIAEHGYFMEDGKVDDYLGQTWEETGVYPYKGYPFWDFSG